jgi:hypothetical protein
MSLPFAIGNYFLAGRFGRSRVLWVVLSLIPLLNLFLWIWIVYLVLFRVLDSLKAIAERVGAPTSE